MIEDEETKEQMVSILQGLVSEWCGGPDGGSRVAEALMSTSRVTFAERAVYALCAADPKAATPAVPYLVATLGATNEFADSPSPAYLLAQIGSNAVPALVESLASTNDVVCEHAVRALAWIESDARYAAIPALVECLGREEPDVYMSAGAALRRFGAAAIPPLVEALESTNTSTVTHALMILAKADEPLDSDAMQAVARLLRHSNFSVRYSAAHALSRFGAAAVPVLTELLEDDVLAVRVMAAEALGELGPDAHAAVAALEELAKSDQRAVAQSAQAALSKISGAPPTRP